MLSQREKPEGEKRGRSPAALALVVWLLAVLLTLPQGLLVSRPAAQLPGLPAGQLPGQSEEESESWPKSEARHAPQNSGTGRGKRSWHSQFRSLIHFELARQTQEAGCVTTCSSLTGDRASTSRLRC